MNSKIFALTVGTGILVTGPANAQSAKDTQKATAQCAAHGYAADTGLAACIEGELAAIKLKKHEKRKRFWSIVAAGLGGAAEGANSSQTYATTNSNSGWQNTGPTMCPDGTYVGGPRCEMTPRGNYVGGTPSMAPDGSYVAGPAQITPNGSYVGAGRTTMCPDGSYVNGTSCTLAPDGRYVGKQ